MTVNDSALGCCPRCDRTVPAGELLIKYTSPSGETATFATCPDCHLVVAPE